MKLVWPLTSINKGGNLIKILLDLSGGKLYIYNMKAKRDTYYYSIKIGFKSEGIDFDNAEKKLETDVHDLIRISNKRSQLAMQKADVMSEKFMRLATSERKREKKKAFYAKHKNRK